MKTTRSRKRFGLDLLEFAHYYGGAKLDELANAAGTLPVHLRRAAVGRKRIERTEEA